MQAAAQPAKELQNRGRFRGRGNLEGSGKGHASQDSITIRINIPRPWLAKRPICNEGDTAMRQSQHLSSQLINIVECHADKLTRDTVQNLQTNPRTPSYNELPCIELTYRVNEIYQNLSRWLWDKTDPVIRSWYNELGEKRFKEGIPIQELLWALVLTKYQLIDYLDACSLADSAMELYRQQELDRLIGRFFDRAACYAAEGYEREASLHERQNVKTSSVEGRTP